MPNRLMGKDRINIVVVAVPIEFAARAGVSAVEGRNIGRINAKRLTNSHIPLKDNLNRSFI